MMIAMTPTIHQGNGELVPEEQVEYLATGLGGHGADVGRQGRRDQRRQHRDAETEGDDALTPK